MMNSENDKGGAIEAVVIFRTDYENIACRVLGAFSASDYKARTGFVYTDGEFQIVIKGEMSLDEMHDLGRRARTIASYDMQRSPLSSYQQFDKF